ncbi:putative S-adenosylmethionine-dependent methyltransferase [Clostridium tepidiprofundi DSM 19306]|uniref:Putative S-adenosylmethionine-dependent methyltransferase n=1 Tax=Clostridium tepidiprofundi DSM 19306 TaxID=1121338 RepID=A0A151B441_9CLOT|nr:methyltransferase domain-containing protein [Clostridium tepidiprofundi]KYH34417.1 putative S-adenosylmethionine-dependent methyltransferase [Clostridium tepidiprofundi DSM 19306]
MKNEIKKKLAFIVRDGLDGFINYIIENISEEYETKKVIVKESKQIDEAMEWGDICWFEWCDQLIAYGSRLKIAEEKKILCRIHSYEAFTNNIVNVAWENVDKLIFVSEYIRENVLSKIKINKSKTVVIPNGVDLKEYNYQKRNNKFNIAYVGFINYKKGPMLLLHTFKAIHDVDDRYKLYIAGLFQDERYLLYFKQMINEMNLKDCIIFDGWQKNIENWLNDKDYILCTSVLESQNMSVMQAMAKGIKPIIHNFVGAKEIYPVRYIWNTIDEAVNMVVSDNYDSMEYRNFIKDNYSLYKQMKSIKNMLRNLNNNLTIDYVRNTIDNFSAYDVEYIDNFDFKNSKIKIGKIEKVSETFKIVECIIENEYGKKLVLNNIWYDTQNNKIYMSEGFAYSKNLEFIKNIVVQILNLNVNYTNNIAGFIFDEYIVEDIKENKLAYIWERGIPATQFMPTLGYLRIVERYLFAGKYIKNTDKVLEAACGFGYGAAYFSKLCNRVYALDIAYENIEFGKNAYDFSNICWQLGDVSKLPYKNEEFDVYVSFETLEHLPLDTVSNYFNEAYRVLKKDGYMIVSTPNRNMRMNINNPFHVKEYDFNEFKYLLEKYFDNIDYYSVVENKIEEGILYDATVMIAVCVK